MKSEMIRCLTNAVASLEEVDDTVEWVTKDEEEDYDIDPAGGYGLHSHI